MSARLMMIFILCVVCACKKNEASPKDEVHLKVPREQFYLGTENKFPIDKFYAFKVGRTKESAILLFGSPFSNYTWRQIGTNKNGGQFFYYTKNSIISSTYKWVFDYDEKGIIVNKYVKYASS